MLIGVVGVFDKYNYFATSGDRMEQNNDIVKVKRKGNKHK